MSKSVDTFRNRDRELMRWVNRTADGQQSGEHEALSFILVADSVGRDFGIDPNWLRSHLVWRLNKWSDQLKGLTDKEAERPWNAAPKSCSCMGCKCAYSVITGLRAAQAWHAAEEAAAVAARTPTDQAVGAARFAAEQSKAAHAIFEDAAKAAIAAKYKNAANASSGKDLRNVS